MGSLGLYAGATDSPCASSSGRTSAAVCFHHHYELQRPILATVGELPTRLVRSALPLATELEQTLAWTAALTERTDDDLKSIISQPPPREPQTPWLELASTIAQLHESLHSNELQFSDVLQSELSTADRSRWQLLNEIHSRYLNLLHQAERQDTQVALLEAQAGKIHCPHKLVLVGTSDLSRSLTSLLKSLPSDCSVTALVAADDQDRDHFDSFGTVVTQRWIDRKVPLERGQLFAGQDVPDQARLAAEIVYEFQCANKQGVHASSTRNSWNPSTSPHPLVTVGVTDESQVAPVEFELRSLNVSSCRELGWSISQTSIGRLLNLLADYLSSQDWRHFAALIRHTDIAQWLHSQLPEQPWLSDVDQLLNDHFPTGTIEELPLRVVDKHPLAVQVRRLLDQSLQDLHHARRPLTQWALRLADWIEWLDSQLQSCGMTAGAFDGKASSATGRSQRAREDTVAYLQNAKDLQRQLDVSVDSSTAIEMLLSRLRTLRIVEEREDCPVSIVGWLDLALDDAKEMVVMALNHPFVPEPAVADPFIPLALRNRIQLSENERRYARDLHALEVILQTRQRGAVKFIVGGSSADGSPTPPSRLLSSGTPFEVACRLIELYKPRPESQSLKPKQDLWAQPLAQSRLPIPSLEPKQPVQRLSVTAFKDYLTCPYRFYLRHVLHIRPLDDSAGELMANQFGDLIHHVLEDFGCGELRDTMNPDAIESELHRLLDQQVADHFGASTTAAVRLQVEQARRRLSHVAQAQAERRAQGWRIHAVEAPLSKDDTAGISVDGEWMPIRGRIDRIDRNEVTGQWAIIDYKTHGHTPRKKHLRVAEGVSQWIDLQLPLYRMLVPFVLRADVEVSQVSLSYFNIGENREQTGVNDADFTAEEFAKADATIHDCVRRIRRGDFEPAAAVEFDDYAMILQTGAVATLFQRLNPAGPEDEA